MFMVLKEDIQNVLFKCEKIAESNNIKLTRLKKEYKMLCKVLKDYELSDDNSIIYNELVTRQNNIAEEIGVLRSEEKSIKKLIRKIEPLLNSMEIIELDNQDNIEIGQLE